MPHEDGEAWELFRNWCELLIWQWLRRLVVKPSRLRTVFRKLRGGGSWVSLNSAVINDWVPSGSGSGRSRPSESGDIGGAGSPPPSRFCQRVTSKLPGVGSTGAGTRSMTGTCRDRSSSENARISRPGSEASSSESSSRATWLARFVGISAVPSLSYSSRRRVCSGDYAWSPGTTLSKNGRDPERFIARLRYSIKPFVTIVGGEPNWESSAHEIRGPFLRASWMARRSIRPRLQAPG